MHTHETVQVLNRSLGYTNQTLVVHRPEASTFVYHASSMSGDAFGFRSRSKLAERTFRNQSKVELSCFSLTEDRLTAASKAIASLTSRASRWACPCKLDIPLRCCNSSLASTYQTVVLASRVRCMLWSGICGGLCFTDCTVSCQREIHGRQKRSDFFPLQRMVNVYGRLTS